jgi:N-acetylglucosaminyldiphosphoundecaprenol N-acetyl-beta-D-mannosaminyltransferase
LSGADPGSGRTGAATASDRFGADPSARADCLGTRVSALSFDGAQQALAALVERGGGACVSPATVYSVMLGVDDPAYRLTVNAAAMVTADGMPLVWLQRRLGWAQAERVHNDDLWFACCARYPGWRHFLVGGRDGQPEVVAAALARRYPGIQVVGLHPTPQRPVPARTTRDIVARIREARPDIVWVGLGTPAQDWWMRSVADEVGVPLVGVGSAFDLLAGRTRPAPEWMKRQGLQWLFRLAQEPRRLGWRYLHYNSRFIAAVLRRRGPRTDRGPVAP